MRESDELLEVINEQGDVIKLVTRSECHLNPSFIHRVVHVLVFDPAREQLYLQKRSRHKDIQPGKWDTSVGGHLCPGEPLEIGAQRELEEELGITGLKLTHLYQYLMSSEHETELVNTYMGIWPGAFHPNPQEIEEGRFWSLQEIERHMGQQLFTPNFEDEYRRYQDWLTKSSSQGAL